MVGELEQAIEKAIQAVFDRKHIVNVFTGTAKKVGETTCDVARSNAPTLLDVRLNAIEGDLPGYMTVYPAENSKVVVALLEGLKTEAVVISCSEIAKVSIKIGEQTLLMDKDGLVFNGGSFGGLVKLQQLESKLNELVTKFNTHTHLVSTTGTAVSQTGTAAATTQTANPFNKADFENDKIKH